MFSLHRSSHFNPIYGNYFVFFSLFNMFHISDGGIEFVIFVSI